MHHRNLLTILTPNISQFIITNYPIKSFQYRKNSAISKKRCKRRCCILLTKVTKVFLVVLLKIFSVYCVESLVVEYWERGTLKCKSKILLHLLFKKNISQSKVPISTVASHKTNISSQTGLNNNPSNIMIGLKLSESQFQKSENLPKEQRTLT